MMGLFNIDRDFKLILFQLKKSKLFYDNYKRERVMVFNATFNNISVISWLSVLLVEKTTDLPEVTDKLYYIILRTSQ
jgi:hypothetical protein